MKEFSSHKNTHLVQLTPEANAQGRVALHLAGSCSAYPGFKRNLDSAMSLKQLQSAWRPIFPVKCSTASTNLKSRQQLSDGGSLRRNVEKPYANSKRAVKGKQSRLRNFSSASDSCVAFT
ncbi:hypothetical protein Ancab_008837 [Ancistrocladus abbreviatus]